MWLRKLAELKRPLLLRVISSKTRRSSVKMGTKNRGSRASNRGQNNNPDGRNQYTGMMGAARNKPFATAAAVGVFLWSRRNQISDQMRTLADQIGEWREGMKTEGASAEGSTSDESLVTASSSPWDSGGRTQAQIAEEALTLKQIGKTG